MSHVASDSIVSRQPTTRRGRKLAFNLVLWRYDVRRALPFWGTSLVCLAILTLLPEGPLSLGDADGVFESAGGLLGILLAWRLFADTGHTQAFVFSRGLSRTQLFWDRWMLGMSLIAIHAGVVWLVLVSGLRSAWRQLLDGVDAPVYPLVAPYETVVIPPFWIASTVAFVITTLLITLRGLQKPSRVVSSGGALAWFLFDLPLTLLVVVYGQAMFASPLAISSGWLLAIGLGAIALFTLVAWHGYRNWEVSS